MINPVLAARLFLPDTVATRADLAAPASESPAAGFALAANTGAAISDVAAMAAKIFAVFIASSPRTIFLSEYRLSRSERGWQQESKSGWPTLLSRAG